MPTGWLELGASPTSKNYLHFRSSKFFRIFIVPLLVIVCAKAALHQSDLTILTADDFKNAEQLGKDEIFRDLVSVEEVNHHRSDIRGPVANQHRFKRNGVSRQAKLWPQARIPYAISPHYSTHERALLARAVKQYHDKTCIRFVPRTGSEGDYLFIGKVDGCFSEVGRTSGVQVLSLDNGCLEYATIIHEMMHVIGFYHEHERWDRDVFIDIIWQNIDRGALDQFGKVDLSKTSYYGQPYDYKSILHYDSLAFSKNGFPTMLPKKSSFASTIGNAKDFSEIDLAKINRMYKCDQRKPFPVNFMGSAKAQVAPIYAPSIYFKNGYNRPTPVDSTHYPYFESMKTPPQPVSEPQPHHSRLADSQAYYSTVSRVRSNSTRRESLDPFDQRSQRKLLVANYSLTGIAALPPALGSTVWPRFGLTSSQSTDTLFSSRYPNHNSLLFPPSILLKDLLLGSEYGHGWLTNSTKLPKLDHHSMALVSHSTIGGPQIFAQQNQNGQPQAESGIVVVGAVDHHSIAHQQQQQQQQIMNGGKPGSSSGSSISGSDSLSGSSSSTAVPSHLNGVRHPYTQHPSQTHHYGHHAQQAAQQIIQNGSPTDANHLVKALFSNDTNLYNQQASPRRLTEPDKPIGYGAFGVVWSVTDPRSQKRVALKKMPNVFQNLASCKRVFREIQMLASFHHDNVLGLLDILHPPNQHFFQEIYVLTELMQSDLHKIIVSPQQLTVDHVKVFIYQILRGLKYLHSAKILHRDIKPGNLLVNSNCILKICDFGLARIWDKGDNSNMTHEVVTQYYRAPELLMGARKYTGAVDVWSVGCIFAELLGRRILFQAHGPIEQLNQIVALLGTPTMEAMKTACEGARNHVLRGIHRPADSRRLFTQFPHAGPEAIHLLQEMLQFDPEKRINVMNALQSQYLEEGRMRFHSCMCSCCYSSSKRERHFAKILDPDHECPFDPSWEKGLSRLSMFELREKMFRYITERKPMYDTPLCINMNSATYAEFQNSSVAQPSELPPQPNAWD